MAKDLGLKLVSHPQEYFYELLSEAMGKKSFKPLPETEVYLLNLLGQFMTTEALFVKEADGSLKSEPLAMMLKEALEAPQGEIQNLLFRQLGDISLYTAGFFQDSLNRKMVDVDYYIDMGGVAYGQVAKRADENALRALYQELAHRFSSFVDILSEIADRTSLGGGSHLLRLYDNWQMTQSERAERALKEAGIIPQRHVKKTIQ